MKEDSTMSRKPIRSVSIAAWTLAATLGLLPAVALAVPMLYVTAGPLAQPICHKAAAPDAYFIEGWGFINGIKVCEVFVDPSTIVPVGVGQCSGLMPNQHAPRITLRNATTYAFVRELASAPAVGWTAGLSTAAMYNLDAQTNCPQRWLKAYSMGLNVP